MNNKEMLIRNSKEPLIIAETAFSHEGSVDYLKEMITNLRNQKNIAIKFQVLINKDDFLTDSNAIYSEIDKWMLSEEQWSETIEFAYTNSVNVILAVLDRTAIEIAKKNKDKISAVEIHPSCIPDNRLLSEAIQFCNLEDIPLIIGVSGFEIKEMDYLMENYMNNFDKDRLILMYGFQNYPTRLSAVNLKRMRIYEKKYGVKVAYADHTEFDNEIKDHLVSMIYGMGVNIFELHYVLEFGIDRIDYITAYDASRIISLHDKLELLFTALGKEEEGMSDSEIEYSVKFRKIPVYYRDYCEGHTLKANDISFKRSTIKSDYTIYESDKLIGKTINKPVKKDQPILKEEFRLI
ncbi:N-acetylneuraminate synthase family protein [Vallitalea pronyensis]|uniref:N-acetylneuraminate synthase family protein n=1 Tax=Vallitalea pronyensis TaxID=1348613 RepID=A0A8J8MNV0_9FIRM|nr:N-acetylneuraminate synthase family protein [Vallitalea pronyensis]QUI25006.1 N-acetylneuraminate synthase family protein [Vallitalea pronyensis]